MWPRRSSRQRIFKVDCTKQCNAPTDSRWIACREWRATAVVRAVAKMTMKVSVEIVEVVTAVASTQCAQHARRMSVTVLLRCPVTVLGVKPHGRLGPLRSEWIAPRPRAAYRRSRLLRPFRELKAPGTIHLGGRFPLRCIQRLSPPIIATRRCPWQDSRDTSGSSDSVLSY